MLVDDERQLVFAHVPKTAGKAITKALGFSHSPSHHDLEGIQQYDDYFRFLFVREPVTRFVSAYRYSVDMIRRGHVDNGHPIRRFIVENDIGDSLRRFVAALQDHPSELVTENLHFRPQVEWVRKVRPHFIGRQESLTQDLRYLGWFLGVDLTKQLEHVNRSRARVGTRLDKATRRWIKECYADDLMNLGYS